MSEFKPSAKEYLAVLVREARRQIPTAPDHAIPNHRADEFLRDLLEETLQETP